MPPTSPSSTEGTTPDEKREGAVEAFGRDLASALEASLDALDSAEIGGEHADVRRSLPPEREDDRYMEFGGVELERGTGAETFVPRKREGMIADGLTLQLQSRLATSASLHQPVLIEGGTSLGKSTVVEDMAAQLNWSLHRLNMVGTSDPDDMMGRYIANPERASELDPEFTFSDGPVTAAIREAAEGHKVVLLIEEMNAAHPNVLIRLHEVIDQYTKSGQIELNEDANERLDVIRSNIVIVATANPPSRGGSNFAGREPLDPAQFRRWVYQKLPDELPAESVDQFTRGLFGLEVEVPEAEGLILHANRERLTRAQIAEIEGIDQIQANYLEFHKGVKALLAKGEVGAGQPQKISFDDREEPARVVEFIANFYHGDINATMKDALAYYYASKVASEEDVAKVLELAAHVRYDPPPDARRRSATPEQQANSGDFLAPPSELELNRAGAELLSLMEDWEEGENKVLVNRIVVAFAGQTEQNKQALANVLSDEDKEAITDRSKCKAEVGIGMDSLDVAQKYFNDNKFIPALIALTGNDHPKAYSLRADILSSAAAPNITHVERAGHVLWSLAGLNDEHARQLRKQLESKVSPADYVLSFIGVSTPASMQYRAKLLEEALAKGNDSEAYRIQVAIGRSLAGIMSAEANELRSRLTTDEAQLYSVAGVANADGDGARSRIIGNIHSLAPQGLRQKRVRNAIIASYQGLPVAQIAAFIASDTLPDLADEEKIRFYGDNYALTAARVARAKADLDVV